MSTSQRVIKNTLYLYIRTLVSLVTSVFTTRILLDALGASDYGLYNVVGGSIAMLGFLSASMGSATQRFLSYAEGAGERDKIEKYFNNSIILHYGLASIMVVIFAVAALLFFNGILNIPAGKHTTAVIIYICMLISTVFSITIVPYEAEINAHENMSFYSILGILDVLFKLGIAITVSYLHGDKLIFYAILMAGESFILRLICQFYCKRKYTECHQTQLKKYYDKAIIKEMTSFAGWNLSNIATGMIALYGMNIVVNHYFGTEVNASMGIATQLSGIMMGLSMNMIKAITPVLVKSEGNNQRQRMLELSYVSCKFSYLLFAFACIPVLIFMSKVLSIWLVCVPEWTESFCISLIIATLIEQLTVALYQSIMAGGDIRNYNIARSVSNLLPLLISMWMFQYTDAAPYWIFIHWILFKALGGGIINLYFSCKKLGLRMHLFLKRVFQPIVLSTLLTIVLGGFASYLCQTLHINELLGLLCTFAGAVPILWITALTENERNIFVSFANKITKRCI